MGRPPIRPVVWSPPPAPTRATADPPTMPPPRLLPVGGVGPEDVAVEAAGTLVTGVDDGRLLRVYPDDGRIEVIATLRGRPLGVEVTADGLVVCDAYDGLLRVDPAGGAVEPLLDRDRVHLCNNAAVAPDGTIYLSDSSQRFALSHHRADIIEHSGTGRLLRRDPDGHLEVLLAGLQFANGVALSADGSFVVVAETGAYRLRRVWLTGPRAGQSDVFADNLPGFPDNVSTAADGRFWVALFAPRNALLDWAHRRHPLLRRALWALPDAMQPQVEKVAWAVALDEAGRVVADLYRRDAGIHEVTGAREHAGRLYLGSLSCDVIGVVQLPAADAPAADAPAGGGPASGTAVPGGPEPDGGADA